MYQYLAKDASAFIWQIAVNYVAKGYFNCVSGRIPPGKDPLKTDRKIIEQYGLSVSKWSNYRRRKRGGASVHYLRFERDFVILATDGQHEFFEAEKAIIRDLRSLPLSIRGYSIMLHPRGQFVSVRIERRRFGAMKKQFEVLATSTSAEALEMKLSRLRLEPFEPVRRKILFLVRKVNAIRRRAGLSQINPPIFRCAKSISIYANKAASF